MIKNILSSSLLLDNYNCSMIKLKKIYNNLNTPELSGKKIGLFRVICAIFGGFLVAYLGMTFLTFLIPDSVENAIFVPLLFNTLAWSIVALWIVVAPSKLSALLRVIIPILIFCILIYIFF